MADCDVFGNESNESEIERLQRQINANIECNKKKQAYLDFLNANPLFAEYQKLKSEAN